MVRGAGMLNFRLLVWAKSGDSESLRQALDTNAQCNVDYTSVRGETPVWAAAKNGYADIVRILVERGANVNIPDKDEGNTALHHAAARGDTDTALLLLDKGAIITCNKAGQSPRDLLAADCAQSLRSALEAAEVAQHFVPPEAPPPDKPPAPSPRKARGGATGARGRGRPAAASTTRLPPGAPPTHPATRTTPAPPTTEPAVIPDPVPSEPAPTAPPAIQPASIPPQPMPEATPAQPPPPPPTEQPPTSTLLPAPPTPTPKSTPPVPPPEPAPVQVTPAPPAPALPASPPTIDPVPVSPTGAKRGSEDCGPPSSKRARSEGAEGQEGSGVASRQQTVDKLRRSRLLLLKRWREGLARAPGPAKGRLEGTGIRKMAGEGQQGGWGYWCCVCGLGLPGLQQADSHLDSGTHTEATLRDLAQRTATGGGGQQVLEGTVSAHHVAVCASQSDIDGLTVAVDMVRAHVEGQDVWAGTGHRVLSVRAVGALARQTLLRGEAVGELLVVVDPAPSTGLAQALARAVGDTLPKGQTCAPHGAYSVAVRLAGHTIICLLVSEPYLKGAAGEDEVHEEQRAEGRRLDAFEFFAAEAKATHGQAGPTLLRSLVQVLRSLQRRQPCYPAWDSLKTWSLELLAAYTVLTMPRRGLGEGLRTAMAHVAGGFFLPGGMALPDPCSDKQGERECTCSYLSCPQSEAVTAVAQDLSRSLAIPRAEPLATWLPPTPPQTATAGTVWTHQ